MDTVTVKLVATKEESGDVDLSESETWSFQEEAVTVRPSIALKTARGKPVASSKSDHSESPKAERKEWPHNLHVFPAKVHHTEAVFLIIRKIYEREPDDPMDDLNVNMDIWSIFLNTSLQAAVHLGQDYGGVFTIREESFLEQCATVIPWNGKMISEQKEITGFNTITWMSTSFCAELISGKPEIIQIILWCGFEGCRRNKRTRLPYFWYRRRTGDATVMPRMHNVLKREEDSCERKVSQE